jgi:WD40 repeat protein
MQDTADDVTSANVATAMPSNVNASAIYSKTFHLNEMCNQGLAVTLDGQHFVVTSRACPVISVYSTSTGECVSSFKIPGEGAGTAARVCATPRGTILATEAERVQELTLAGEHVRFIGEGMLDNQAIFGICMHGDIVAVGKSGAGNDTGRVVLFTYSDGACIRKFGDFGFDEGQIRHASGLSFSPDGTHILVAEYAYQVYMFTTDGVFVKTIGLGHLGHGNYNDVLCSGSNIFVADSGQHRVCVFSLETGELIRTWDSRHLSLDSPDYFKYPTALAVYQNKLFVLDAGGPKVRLFE